MNGRFFRFMNMQKPDKVIKQIYTLTILLLFLGSMTLYLQSTQFDFNNFDVKDVLLAHPELYNQNSFLGSIKNILIECFPREEPLLVRDISWALDALIFGFDNPFGYHFMNVIYNALVVVFLFIFLSMTTKNYQFSLLTSIGFMVLAIHVEPVVWIMGRKGILSSLFMLLSLCCFYVFLTRSNSKLKEIFYVGSIIFTVLALFSKINTVVFPGVLFIYSICLPFLGKGKDGEDHPTKPWFSHLLYVVPHFILSLLAYFWYKQVLTDFGLFNRGYHASMIEHVTNLTKLNPIIIVSYLRSIFVPGVLSPLYTWPNQHTPLSLVQISFSFLVIILLFGLAIWLWLRRRRLFFYFATFFLLMIPYMNLIYIGIWKADRYIYISSFCFVALFVSLIEPILKMKNRLFVVMGWATFLAFAGNNLYKNISYQGVWRSSVSLWEHEVESPAHEGSLDLNTIDIYCNLIDAYIQKANEVKTQKERNFFLDKAKTTLEKTEKKFWPNRQIRPPAYMYKVFLYKARLEEKQGDNIKLQLENLNLVEELNPENKYVYLNKAAIYYQLATKSVNDEELREFAKLSLDNYKKYVYYSHYEFTLMQKYKYFLRRLQSEFPFLNSETEEILREMQ